MESSLNAIYSTHVTGMPILDAIKHLGIRSEVFFLFGMSKGCLLIFSLLHSLSLFMLLLQGHETTYELWIFQPKGNP